MRVLVPPLVLPVVPELALLTCAHFPPPAGAAVLSLESPRVGAVSSLWNSGRMVGKQAHRKPSGISASVQSVVLT